MSSDSSSPFTPPSSDSDDEIMRDALPDPVAYVDGFLPDSDFQAHQPSLPEQWDEEPFLKTDAERAIEKSPLKRSRAMEGLPKPDPIALRSPQAFPNDLKREQATTSLADYFEQQGVPIRQRVSICRAYASYLSAVCPPPPRKRAQKK